MVRISDKKLIKLLMENSRIPFTKLAEELGVTEAAVRKRIKTLEKRGVIRKFTIDVDPKALGYKFDVLIGVDTTPETYIKVIDYLKNIDKVIELYTSTGDHMILIRMWFEDTEEMNFFIRSLEEMQGITRVCPAILLEKLK